MDVFSNVLENGHKWLQLTVVLVFTQYLMRETKRKMYN